MAMARAFFCVLRIEIEMEYYYLFLCTRRVYVMHITPCSIYGMDQTTL